MNVQITIAVEVLKALLQDNSAVERKWSELKKYNSRTKPYFKK